jgi:hypothetical protein
MEFIDEEFISLFYKFVALIINGKAIPVKVSRGP